MDTSLSQPPRRTRRTYTKDFKEGALNLADEVGAAKAGQDLGVDPCVIRGWRRERKRTGSDAFRGHGNRTALEGELTRLRKENAVLVQEREILKKAAAFFARLHS
jgi:transposase